MTDRASCKTCCVGYFTTKPLFFELLVASQSKHLIFLTFQKPVVLFCGKPARISVLFPNSSRAYCIVLGGYNKRNVRNRD